LTDVCLTELRALYSAAKRERWVPEGKGNVLLHLIVVPDFEQPYAAL
jgi:hypothetical protein